MVSPARYRPLGFAQLQELCHHPDFLKAAQLPVYKESLSSSHVENLVLFILLLVVELVKQSSTFPENPDIVTMYLVDFGVLDVTCLVVKVLHVHPHFIPSLAQKVV